MANFLIVGGAGFIGSNVAEYLIKEGHYVRILDNFSSGREENLSFAQGLGQDKFEVIRGDIRDADACAKATQGIDAVSLQAALRSVPKSLVHPEDYNDVNINGIYQVLKACREQGVPRLVFASSSSVYGDVDTFPQQEHFYPKLMSPYALSKLAGEYYCRIFSEHWGVETACLRYFNVFGPRQALDDEYAVVIPKFIHSVVHDQPPPIFGDGHQSRDFTYIDNVVQANVLGMTVPGIKHEVFNVAVGQETKVIDIVTAVNKILGKNVEPEFLPKRAGDVYRTWADIGHIQKVLGFKPTVDFEEGMARTVTYFQNLFSSART